jgi:hypothetical protein
MTCGCAAFAGPMVADDKAGVQFLDSPGRREAAGKLCVRDQRKKRLLGPYPEA